jgi:hypothetical protein
MNKNDSGQNHINIGLIGPRDSVEKILKVLGSQYKNLTLNPYIKERIKDAVDLFDSCQMENDGIFFTGVGVLEEIKKSKKITKPFETIPRSGYSLMSTIWEMEQKQINYNRISIDVVPDKVLYEIIDEFGLSFNKLFTMPFSVENSEEDYIARHVDLFNKGVIDVILTGFGSVYKQLLDMGLPVYRLYPNNIQIRQNLEKLISSIETRGIRSAGIAIQIIRLKGFTYDSLCQYDDLKKRGEFYLELLEYVREIQGSLFAYAREEMIIFTTRGEIENESNWILFKKLMTWGNQMNTIFYSGIGFGITAYEAERSARKALTNAQVLKNSSAYIVDGDQIQGPLCESDELKYFIKVKDKEILEISRKTGLDPTYISKIQALIEKTGKDTFDSEDLSTTLNIGERTARRILKKILDNGYGIVAGKESSSQRGRPKNLIKITL